MKLIMRGFLIFRMLIMLSTKYFACIHPFLGLLIKMVAYLFYAILRESNRLQRVNIYFSFRVERECSKDISYKTIQIKKGTVVSVPANALHYDADYYPEPETFNPDRY